MTFINDFTYSSEKGGAMYAVQAAVAAAVPLLASCAPVPTEFARPAI